MLKTSIRVPTIENLIFGGSTIGCLYKEVGNDQAKEALDEALKCGITHFDTAPWYGAGLSETRFGEYLPKEYNGKKVVISTKSGRIIKEKTKVTDKDRVESGYSDGFKTDKYHQNIPVAIYTHEGVVESVKQSKQRLKRDFIDCLRLHDAEDEDRYAEAIAPGAAIDTMVDMKKKGEIGEVSLGMNSSEFLFRFVKKYPAGTFDNIMMAGCWNLIDQDGYDLLVECQKKNIKVTNVGIFASGLLVGSTNYKYDSAVPQDVKDKVEKWRAIADKYNVKMITLALQFAFIPDVVENVAIGIRDAQKSRANAALFDKSVTAVPLALWKEAQAQGLIRKEVKF